MASLKKTIVHATSKNRLANESICDFDVFLREKLQNVFRIVPHTASIPNVFYNINDNNNQFNIDVGGVVHNMIMPFGFYNLVDGSTLNFINNFRNMIQAFDANLNVTYIELEARIVITHTTSNLTILPSTLNKVLGYPEGGQAFGSITAGAPNMIDLSGVDNVYVHLSFIQGHYLTEARRGIALDLKEDVVCKIPMDVGFGFVAHWNNDEDELLSVNLGGLTNISSFRITLTDEDNNILDTSGIDWSFDFVAYE